MSLTRELHSKVYVEKDLSYDEEKDFLGCGGFAEVFRARLAKPPVVDRLVAFKRIYRRRRNAEQTKDLEKEAGILLSIPRHPHIVELVGVCDSPRCYGLLVEFVEGKDLESCLSSSYEDSAAFRKWDNRLRMSRQIADGMAHLHAQTPAVIHQDLKPQNVLIRRQEGLYICKICDFGLSKMRGISTITSERRGGERPAGTVVYIAPERYSPQLLPEGKKLEYAKKSDVYSFGVILWEIRELKHPYQDELPTVVHEIVKSGQALPSPQAKSPENYDDLQARCSIPDADQRPSFTEIQTELGLITAED